MLYVYPIVEGHGEERALPVLIRQFYSSRHQYHEVIIFSPYRIPKDRMTIDLYGAIALARARLISAMDPLHDVALILLMRDADDDCPVQLKERFDQIASANLAPILFEFVAPVSEFEAWFIEMRECFRGHLDCREVLEDVENVEGIRGAKQYFERNILKDGRYYSETVDQPKFSSMLDFSGNEERWCRSLRRFINVLDTAKYALP